MPEVEEYTPLSSHLINISTNGITWYFVNRGATVRRGRVGGRVGRGGGIRRLTDVTLTRGCESSQERERLKGCLFVCLLGRGVVICE